MLPPVLLLLPFFKAYRAAIVPEKDGKANQGNAQDNAHYEASAYVGIARAVVGELPGEDDVGVRWKIFPISGERSVPGDIHPTCYWKLCALAHMRIWLYKCTMNIVVGEDASKTGDPRSTMCSVPRGDLGSSERADGCMRDAMHALAHEGREAIKGSEQKAWGASISNHSDARLGGREDVSDGRREVLLLFHSDVRLRC